MRMPVRGLTATVGDEKGHEGRGMRCAGSHAFISNWSNTLEVNVEGIYFAFVRIVIRQSQVLPYQFSLVPPPAAYSSQCRHPLFYFPSESFLRLLWWFSEELDPGGSLDVTQVQMFSLATLAAAAWRT